MAQPNQSKETLAWSHDSSGSDHILSDRPVSSICALNRFDDYLVCSHSPQIDLCIMYRVINVRQAIHWLENKQLYVINVHYASDPFDAPIYGFILLEVDNDKAASFIANMDTFMARRTKKYVEMSDNYHKDVIQIDDPGH